MAAPSFSYHQVAQAKQLKRRGQASEGGLWGAKLDTLVGIGVKLFGDELKMSSDDKDYSTVAIGHLQSMEKQFLIVAMKGIKHQPDEDAVRKVARGLLEDYPELTVVLLVDETSYRNDDASGTHLHAEMAIVQYVASNLGVPKDCMAKFGLEIACVMKGVCPDCSGWMTRYAIPHTQTRTNVATNGWTHPLSGAFFKGKGQDLQYIKNLGQNTWMVTSKSKTTKYPGTSKATML